MVARKNLLMLLIVFGAAACNGQGGSVSQTETAEALLAQNQAATNEAQAAASVATDTIAAPPPVSTPTRDRTANCDPGQTLDEVRASLPVDEFAVHYNISQGLWTLVIWSVNTEILVPVSEAAISEMLDQAWMHSGRMAMEAVNASPCVSQLFDAIDTIVVDSAYNGWLSGQYQVANIPYGASFDENESIALQVLDSLYPTYVRQALPLEVPQGSCDWPQALQNIWSHFSPERKNIAFYYTIDEYGGNVWAQWDGPPDDAMFLASILNVMLGLECFNPEANIIAMVVDETGNMIKIAVVPEMNLDAMEVMNR